MPRLVSRFARTAMVSNGSASLTMNRPRQSPRGRRRGALAWLLRAILGLSVVGLALAVAALLNVSSPSLGSNTVVTAACDTNGITATPSVSYSATTGGYVVDSVLLAGLANACRNQDYSVSLVGPGGLLATSTLSNVPVASFGGTSNANTLSLSFVTANPRVAAEQMTTIHLAISD